MKRGIKLGQSINRVGYKDLYLGLKSDLNDMKRLFVALRDTKTSDDNGLWDDGYNSAMETVLREFDRLESR